MYTGSAVCRKLRGWSLAYPNLSGCVIVARLEVAISFNGTIVPFRDDRRRLYCDATWCWGA